MTGLLDKVVPLPEVDPTLKANIERTCHLSLAAIKQHKAFKDQMQPLWS